MESEGRPSSLVENQTRFDVVGFRTETPPQAGSGKVLVPRRSIDPLAFSVLEMVGPQQSNKAGNSLAVHRAENWSPGLPAQPA